MASVRPACLDELLTLMDELHYDNLYMDRAPNGALEMTEELVGKLGTKFSALIGEAMLVRDCYCVEVAKLFLNLRKLGIP